MFDEFFNERMQSDELSDEVKEFLKRFAPEMREWAFEFYIYGVSETHNAVLTKARRINAALERNGLLACFQDAAKRLRPSSPR
mgnify:CR=1 FL=1